MYTHYKKCPLILHSVSMVSLRKADHATARGILGGNPGGILGETLIEFQKKFPEIFFFLRKPLGIPRETSDRLQLEVSAGIPRRISQETAPINPSKNASRRIPITIPGEFQEYF